MNNNLIYVITRDEYEDQSFIYMTKDKSEVDMFKKFMDENDKHHLSPYRVRAYTPDELNDSLEEFKLLVKSMYDDNDESEYDGE